MGEISFLFQYCMNEKVDSELKTVQSVFPFMKYFSNYSMQFYVSLQALFQFVMLENDMDWLPWKVFKT